MKSDKQALCHQISYHVLTQQIYDRQIHNDSVSRERGMKNEEQRRRIISNEKIFKANNREQSFPVWDPAKLY